jgi:hypothetical protein
MLLRGGKALPPLIARWFSSLTYAADRDETLTLRVLGQTKHQVEYDLFTLSGARIMAAITPPTN